VRRPLEKRRWKALNGTNAPAVSPGKSDSADRSRSRITLRLHFEDGRICQTNERRSVNRIRRRRVVGFFTSNRPGKVINMCIIIGRYTHYTRRGIYTNIIRRLFCSLDYRGQSEFKRIYYNL